MVPKVIKTDGQYEAALARIDELMDAEQGTVEADELELFAALAESYEQQIWPVDLPDPLDAIRFRMDQQGLRQRDLVPCFGSPAKVSEVLNGKRPLSLNMIRSLHEHLGIPSDVLLQDPSKSGSTETESLDWRRFPLREMVKRGWVTGFAEGSLREARDRAEELVGRFLKPICDEGFSPALLRRHVRCGSDPDEYALLAWQARVLLLAREQTTAPYVPGTITSDFMQRLVQLSYMESGPALAQEFLAKNGIHLVVERHLPGTHLDGAAMVSPSGHPVVGMTLRYDRLDNFWFTLCHELAHIALHLKDVENESFLDDLRAEGDALEDAADEYAGDSLIPADVWEQQQFSDRPTAGEARALAALLRIHPGIVAGRLRWERDDWGLLTNLVGRGQVREQFAQ